MNQVSLRWAVDFQLHEVACLIAGVEALSNVAYPPPQTLPPECIHVLQRLIEAVGWPSGGETDFALKGVLLREAPSKNYLWPYRPSHQEFEVLSVVVAREEVHRWLQEANLPSKFDFGPHIPDEPPNDPFFRVERHGIREQLVSPGSAYSPIPDESDGQRRLRVLRELGGDAKKRRHGDWRFTGIRALVDKEVQDGRPRSSEKTVRDDLREAAEAEREARSAGLFPTA